MTAGDSQPFDIAVVGAGLYGLAVGVAARERGLSCAIFDREGTLPRLFLNFPGRLTYRPIRLP